MTCCELEPAVDVSPSGFVTVIFAMDAVARSSAGTAALSFDELVYVVASALAFQFTTACGLKLLPLTDSVDAEEPARILDGVTLATTGACAVVVPLKLPPPPEQPATANKVSEKTRTN